MRRRVIGVGSAHGDDAVGLVVAHALARGGLAGVAEVVVRCTPGLALVEDLRDVDGIVLVDALRAGGAPGAIREVAPHALARAARGSSHALGVADALRLADALGLRPVVRIIGVEVGAERDVAGGGTRAVAAEPALGWASLSGLSPAVRAAVPAVCRRVCAALTALAHPSAGP